MFDNQLILACEHGVRFVRMDNTMRHFTVLSEVYLEESLVSQVLEYDAGKLIAAVYREDGYKLINRETRSIMFLNKDVSKFKL